MTSTQTAEAKKTAVFAKTSTAQLVLAALMLNEKIKSGHKTPEERLSLAWISDELESRAGMIQDDAAFDALLDDGLTYIEALLVMFPELTK